MEAQHSRYNASAKSNPNKNSAPICCERVKRMESKGKGQSAKGKALAATSN